MPDLIASASELTIQDVRRQGTMWTPMNDTVLHITAGSTSGSELFTPWGYSTRRRDDELRAFWPTEPWLASAVTMRAMTRSSINFRLDGPPRIVGKIQEVLQMSDLGRGWETLMLKVSVDLDTQDNGAFIEVVRMEPVDPDKVKLYARGEIAPAPMINLVHMDSRNCYRTGDPLIPVIYYDPITGKKSRLTYLDVIPLSELPSPIATMKGVQLCYVSRVLREAQLMKDIGVLRAEKAAGRFVRRIHLVSGVQTRLIEDKIKMDEDRADNRGLSHYIHPVVIGGLDPRAGVSVATIDLAEAPSESQNVVMNYYIGLLALAGGDEYQDLFPLPGQGIGTSNQSAILHRKARQRGRASFRRMIMRGLNFGQVLPKKVRFLYEENDIEDQLAVANLQGVRAINRKTRIDSGEITIPIAQQIAADEGDLAPPYLAILTTDSTADITPDIVQDDLDPLQVKSIKAQDQLEDDYDSALSALAGDAISRSIDRDEFIRLGYALADTFIRNAYVQGAEITEDDLTADEETYLDERIALEKEAIDSLADDLYASKKDEVSPIAYARERISRFIGKLGEVISIGILALRSDPNIEWLRDPAKDSCPTCIRLNGQVHKKKEWSASGYHPRASVLDCKGYKCGCRFAKTKKAISGGF